MEANNDSVLFRVASGTDCNKLAGSIISAYEELPKRPIILRAIGAGSLNQGIKAIIVSNRMFSKLGLTARLTPYFKVLDNQGEGKPSITAIEMRVEFK